MTQILHRGVCHWSEESVAVNRAMSFRDFIADNNSEFGLRSFVLNKVGAQEGWEGGWPGYKIPMKARGRGQILCLIAHFRSWYFKGTTMSYCHHCPHYEKQTTHMDAGGLTEVCGKGFWLQDAN